MTTDLLFDLESNGLLTATKDRKTGVMVPPMDRVHCGVTTNLQTGEVLDFKPHQLRDFYAYLAEADMVVGHNIVGFDLKAIKKVLPEFKLKPTCQVRDTLVLSKVVWPVDVLLNLDIPLFKKGKLPGQYIKRYSLAAWGCRFGEHKGEYTGGWAEWNQDMHDYMIQDAKSNMPLWRRIEYRLGWTAEAREKGIYEWPILPIEIEHGAADIVADQELVGVGWDGDGAARFAADLTNQQAALTEKLKDIFGSWWEALDDKKTGRYPKRDLAKKLTDFPDVRTPRYSEKTGKRLRDYIGPPLEYYHADAPFVRIRRTEFNPSSRKHLGDRLQRVFGWTPVLFTDNDQAQVDEGVIKNIPDEVISEETRRSILDYFVVTKTLGMLLGGKKSWMESVRKETGRIHGRCDTLGTITTRATHSNPNCAQPPKVEADKETHKPILGIPGGFGFEFRSLIVPREGWELSGTDMSSLEFILLGHDLYPLDEGVFSERVSDPSRDPHQEHSELTGLGRSDTKNVGYAYIFGAGDIKLGVMVGVTADEIKDLLKFKGLQGKLNWRKKILGADYKEPSEREKATLAKGAIVKKKFEDAITGLSFLKNDMTAIAKERGWIKSIAGHKLVCRKPHAALNTRLQGGGAAACKLWMILMHMKLRDGHISIPLPLIESLSEFKAGDCHQMILGKDYNQVLWVHDELQSEHRKGLGPIFKSVSLEASQRAGEILGLKGRFRTDTKHGRSWAETH